MWKRMLWKKTIIVLTLFVICVAGLGWWLATRPVPEQMQYGASFNTLYATELGLDWQTVYDAVINDLGVRHLRLAAHWPMIETQENIYNFTELDYQIARAEEVDATVVLAVGRRLPRWPECHIPKWARELSVLAQQQAILEYIEAVVTRYKNSPAVTYWQVENEPYLRVFAFEHCGELDEKFLEAEIALVKRLDPERPILLTDSGNLGLWTSAYERGDAFGTSVYVHFWNPELGQFRTILPPWFYRMKVSAMELFYGQKESMLIELSAEPWLLEPVTSVDIETQYSRMDLEKFEDIIDYATATRFQKQYFWGVEWWYWLHGRGHSEMWTRGQELFEQ